MNWNVIRLVTGAALIFVGVRQLAAADQSQYLFGGGLVIWGAASVFLAWANKSGSAGARRLAGILYLVGCLVTIIGLVLGYYS